MTPTGKTRLTVVAEEKQHIFEPQGREIEEPLTVLLRKRGFSLNTRCGENGLCRGCECILKTGTLSLAGKSLNAGSGVSAFRSCQARLLPGESPEIEIPDRSLLHHQPDVASDFKVRVPVGKNPLFSGSRPYAAAVDIGTTTIMVAIIDTRTGGLLARAGDFNAQIHFGDNVLTRIQACNDDPANIIAQQKAVVEENLLPLLRKACTEANCPPEELAGLAVAGNTTMLHLLTGTDPAPLGFAPFRAAFLEERELRLEDLSAAPAPFDSHLPVVLLPGISAYVGADIGAGLFATGTPYQTTPTLFLDVGTNGELALFHDRKLWVTATAAGPAFEGSGLRCGTRASRGAIREIRIQEEPFSVEWKSIGESTQPHGICGTAYLDFLSEGARTGLLTPTGRFNPDWVRDFPDSFGTDEGESLLFLHRSRSSSVFISEADVALLLQAKAAIAAGIEILLRQASLRAPDVHKLFLAGGFGLNLDLRSATGSGLLPGFSPATIEAVGNTSLAGAYLALLDRILIREINRFRKTATVVELNLQPDFEDTYIDNLMLE